MSAFKDKLDAREHLNFGNHQRESGEIQHRGAAFEARLPAPPVDDAADPVKRKTAVTCPSVSLVCDSVSASKSKCGFIAFDGSGKRYSSYELTRSGSYSASQTLSGCSPASSNFTSTFTSNVAESTKKHYAANCAIVVDSTTASSDSERKFKGTTNYSCSSTTDTGCWYPGFTSCGASPDPVTVITAASLTTTRSHVQSGDSSSACNDASGNPVSAHCSATGSESNDETLSDEYTTAILKTNAVAALPVYSGFAGPHSTPGQGTTCSANATLSSNEYSYSIRRFKYKFIFSDAAPVGAVAYWTKRFIPTLTASVVYNGATYAAGQPDPNPANWTNTAMSWTVPDDGFTYLETDVLTMTEPSTNGTTTIVNISTDCSNVVNSSTYLSDVT